MDGLNVKNLETGEHTKRWEEKGIELSEVATNAYIMLKQIALCQKSYIR
jgi:hypothetical protein